MSTVCVSCVAYVFCKTAEISSARARAPGANAPDAHLLAPLLDCVFLLVSAWLRGKRNTTVGYRVPSFRDEPKWRLVKNRCPTSVFQVNGMTKLLFFWRFNFHPCQNDPFPKRGLGRKPRPRAAAGARESVDSSMRELSLPRVGSPSTSYGGPLSKQNPGPLKS